MLCKETFGEKFKALARIFPGMPSYQDRESLRAQDKVIRSRLAERIAEQSSHIDQVKAELVDRGVLAPLAGLDRVCRKLQRLADSIRFASYGYAGVFADAPVDEEKLLQLYNYDLELHQDVEELAVAVITLQQSPSGELTEGFWEGIGQALERLEERIDKRQSIFAAQ